METETKRKRRFFSFKYIREERRRNILLGCVLLWSFLCYEGIQAFLLGSVIVRGDSMSPTLHDGENLIIYRWVYFMRKPRRGDIAVIRDPAAEALSVKRVIGTPGETVAVRQNAVWINGAKLAEPYLQGETPTPSFKMGGTILHLGEEEYFVLGDNRVVSEDSRFFGPLRRPDLLGVISRR